MIDSGNPFLECRREREFTFTPAGMFQRIIDGCHFSPWLLQSEKIRNYLIELFIG